MPTEPSRIPSTSGVAAPEPPLRADARHNRDRILEAAHEAFAAHGLGVPMARIARRAGVGPATLYRRFPTKEALVSEVFAGQLADCAGVVDEALADPDPWRGFRTVIERVCAMQAVDRGFSTAFLAVFPDAFAVDEERDRAERGFAALVRRAQRAGRLRADFVPEDLVLLLMANSGVTACAGEAAPDASRRLVGYLLRALRAEDAPPAPLPPAVPLGLDRLHAAR